MGLFGRLTGKDPPKVPAGGRAYSSMDNIDGTAWSVRVEMPPRPQSTKDKRISPTFRYLVNADKYLDWINGGAPFVYPEGEA